MKNGQVGERVRMYLEGIPQNGKIIEVQANRSIKVLWDDRLDSIEHESQLIRLVPKKMVSRHELSNWWDEYSVYASGDDNYCEKAFDALCKLVGAK